MSKLKQKRNRGVILTPEGLQLLEEAKLQAEIEVGSRYTYEKLSEITSLDINTIRKILTAKEGVDRRSLKKFFLAFNLSLEDKLCAKPHKIKLHDWGEAIAIDHFFGRELELTTLSQWLLQDKCRLVTLLGMGGIGKTTLSLQLAHQIESQFDCIIWKSLRDAPPVQEIVGALLEFLSEGTEIAAQATTRPSQQISQLIKHLRNRRCLILLDNAESIMEGSGRAGTYCPGYEGYGELLRRVGSTKHNSCLMLTSREKPKEVAIVEGAELPVRSLKLSGLQQQGVEIIRVKGLVGSESELQNLCDRYDGNPLALKVVATTIQDLFQGNIREFLQQDKAVFGDIRDILEQQLDRLSETELEIMYWLAIAREPVSLEQLRSDFIRPSKTMILLEALESLSRRSLIEKNAAQFTQQSVVMEYLTSCLVEILSEEIVRQQPAYLLNLPLIKATAKDYVRENQIRLILQPVVNELIAFFKFPQDLQSALYQLLQNLQSTALIEQGYGPGNIINILGHLDTDFTGADFSNLSIAQADFRQLQLPGVNFQNSNLAKSSFAENFGGVWSVAYSPDGKYLASGDTKGEIILRRVKDDQLVRRLEGHQGWVVSIAFSPDGKTLASSSTDCTIKLWNLETGQCLHTLRDHHQEVWTIAFSPDGTKLASGGDDNLARIWQVSNGECLKTFVGHQSEVLAVDFSVDGHQLLSGSQDSTIRIWEISSGELRQTLEGHEDGIRSLSISPDGTMIASGSNDRSIRLWEFQSGCCLEVFTGHHNVVLKVVFSPQGNLLASGSIGHKIRLWDIDTGDCLRVLTGHSNVINAIAFNPEGTILASGSYDQTIKLWQVSTYHCIKTWQGYSNQTLSATFGLDQTTLISGGQDQQVRIWDISTGQVLRNLHHHKNAVLSLDFHPQQQLFASGSSDATVKLWNGTTGQVVHNLTGHTAVVRSVTFSPDGQVLASCSEDRTIKLWQIATGKCLRTLKGHQAEVWSISFSIDGQWLASSSFDGTVKLWSIPTGKLYQTLSGHKSWVWSVAFSPDNKTLVSSSTDQSLRFWDVHTGECKTILNEHIGNTQLLTISHNGQIMASGNQDHKIRLWQLSDKHCYQTLPGHEALITSISFSKDDSTLVSSSEDETIKLWNLSTGQCLQTFIADPPYKGMNLKGVRGLSKVNLNMLKALGAKI